MNVLFTRAARVAMAALCAVPAVSLPACSSGPVRGVGLGPVGDVAAANGPARAAEPQPDVYVLYEYANTLAVYSHSGKYVVRTITDGIHGPHAMAIDSQGTLYIGNIIHSGGGFVKVYPPGASSPITTISTHGRPVLAVDANDDLYVATDKVNGVKVYADQGRTLLRTIKGTPRPTTLALDGSGNLYAAFSQGVNVYEAGGSKLLRTISIVDPVALAFDSAGELYVLTQSNGNGLIAEFPPGSTKRDREITDGIYRPNAMALDGKDSLYVANCGECLQSNSGNVTVYAKGKTAVLRTIDRGVNGPIAIAYGTPNLYVANFHAADVTMYLNGKPGLLRTISPPSGYGLPVAIGFGP